MRLRECKNCQEILSSKDLETHIKDNGDLTIDEEETSKYNDRYISSGKQVWELICSKCGANWEYEYSWIPDNSGGGFKRNGRTIDV